MLTTFTEIGLTVYDEVLTRSTGWKHDIILFGLNTSANNVGNSPCTTHILRLDH